MAKRQWEYLVKDYYVGEDTLETDDATETKLNRPGSQGWELVSANWQWVTIGTTKTDTDKVVSWRERAYRTIWKREKDK